MSWETPVDNDALLGRCMQVTTQHLTVLRAVSDGRQSTTDVIYGVARAEIGAVGDTP